MKKLFLCLLAITAAISTAWAQTPKKNIFGLRVGMDMSKISILDTGSGEKYLSELRTSFNIGLTDQIRLLNDKPFYFQFGLMLHNKGGKVQATDGGSDIELSLNAMYLELPVMLNYHIRLAPKVAVIPFAGFYGSLGVDGKQSFDDLGLEIQQNLFGKNKMFQRGDFGGRIGIGLSIHSVYIGASVSSTSPRKTTPPNSATAVGPSPSATIFNPSVFLFHYRKSVSGPRPGVPKQT